MLIPPIHAAAMFNRMRGLEGKYVLDYVNRDENIIVTSHSVTFRMTLYSRKRGLEGKLLVLFGSVNRVYDTLTAERNSTSFC